MLNHSEADQAFNSQLDDVPVSEVFRRLWVCFEALEKGTAPPLNVDDCVATCKRLIPTIEWLDSETRSMHHDDLTTGELELILLPALLAFFEDKLPVSNATDRKGKLTRILALYRFYLVSFRRLHLALPDGKEDDEDDEESNQTARSPEYLRAKAIANFQWQRTLFARIESQSSVDQDSDSSRRQRAKDMLCYWVYRARRETELANKEAKLLASMPTSSSNLASDISANTSLNKTVRESLREQVFGMGYPSAPTLTPGEWFDQKQLAESRHGHGGQSQPGPKKSSDDDTDSDEEEQRRQDKIRTDAFKDSHRRGEGNTYRRG